MRLDTRDLRSKYMSSPLSVFIIPKVFLLFDQQINPTSRAVTSKKERKKTGDTKILPKLLLKRDHPTRLPRVSDTAEWPVDGPLTQLLVTTYSPHAHTPTYLGGKRPIERNMFVCVWCVCVCFYGFRSDMHVSMRNSTVNSTNAWLSKSTRLSPVLSGVNRHSSLAFWPLWSMCAGIPRSSSWVPTNVIKSL